MVDDIVDLGPYLKAKEFADLWEEGRHREAKALFSKILPENKEISRDAIVRILDRRKIDGREE